MMIIFCDCGKRGQAFQFMAQEMMQNLRYVVVFHIFEYNVYLLCTRLRIHSILLLQEKIHGAKSPKHVYIYIYVCVCVYVAQLHESKGDMV